ncbi:MULTISPECIES: hypothetical protein [Bacteroidaceae]|jgi:hypothetical protein|uniref:Uncharacterized protein n=8 Tax=Bacteroidaceae TaxID=815 RepID=A0A414FLW1_9BACT|nr:MULTISPECIES: hypothetical protein [Bacteroidaceae]KAA5314109.1 hypothetical protein F2Z07_21595 [Phocaeicola dorei]KAB3913268.1 hypothetical protein GAS26_07955 [Bacteroides uniformis]KAB3926163.1 hypothetical protein GAS22_14930 [Bacteroides uniformis]KAB3926288.1 hypothetical protein GAS16_09295 [Bacteroides uniformis]KAB3943604.1 hypothetical protein GAS23_05045 [Bacteroides uniformis]
MVLVITIILNLLILFLVVCATALRKKRILILILILINSVVYLYFFTLLPVYLGIKNEKIEIVKIDKIDNFKHVNIKYFIGDGAVIFKSKNNIDDYHIVFVAANVSDFKYEDILEMENNGNIIIKSNGCYSIKNGNNYLYIAPFFIDNIANTKKYVYCKVFLIRMFSPIYQTNEIKLSIERLYMFNN